MKKDHEQRTEAEQPAVKARMAVVQGTGGCVRPARHMTGSCWVTPTLSQPRDKLVPHGVSLKVSAGFGGYAGGFPDNESFCPA